MAGQVTLFAELVADAACLLLPLIPPEVAAGEGALCGGVEQVAADGLVVGVRVVVEREVVQCDLAVEFDRSGKPVPGVQQLPGTVVSQVWGGEDVVDEAVQSAQV